MDFSDLLVFVDTDLAVLSGDGGQLHTDVAVLVPAQEARLGHQGEHGAVLPRPLDHHHGPVERHLEPPTSNERNEELALQFSLVSLAGAGAWFPSFPAFLSLFKQQTRSLE